MLLLGYRVNFATRDLWSVSVLLNTLEECVQRERERGEKVGRGEGGEGNVLRLM